MKEAKKSDEKARNPERNYTGISQLTIFVPALNEGANLVGLIQSFNLQTLPPNVSIRMVISDNGSNQVTRDEYARLQAEGKFEIQGEPITLVEGSRRGFVGSARKLALETALHSEIDPSKHVVISFDADSRLISPRALEELIRIFSHPDTMVAYGPIILRSTKGETSRAYEKVQKQYNNLLLRLLFAQNHRRMSDYINPPHDLFIGIFTAMRASAFLEDASSQPSFSYKDDITGDDVRMSLELQYRFEGKQIEYSPALATYTSLRGYETRRGHFSFIRSARKAVAVFLERGHIPHSISDDATTTTTTLNPEQRRELLRNFNFTSVVGSFIDDVDHRIYNGQLRDDETIVKFINKRAAQRIPKEGDRIIPKIDRRTGKVIPNKFALVRNA